MMHATLLVEDRRIVYVREIAGGSASVELTVDELVGLNNALNEALECLEPWEFQTRMGVEREKAEALQEQIGSLLDEVRQSDA
jgi:hypothetical protein